MPSDANRVLIIGHRSGDPLPQLAGDGTGFGYTAVFQCANRVEFLRAVMSAAQCRAIDLLDIFDHGSPGAMNIGDETLIDLSSASPPDVSVFASLPRYLRATGMVRLLGCNTAVGSAGRVLLLTLAVLLGEERRVYGTIDRVYATHFGPTGFTLVDELLFSSDAAIDSEAPTIEGRKNSIVNVLLPIVQG